MLKLREILKIERDLQKEGLASRGNLHLMNEAARYPLDQDLEIKSGSDRHYEMNDVIRDRLIAHARQDAALAVFLAHETMINSRTAKLLGWMMLLMLGLLLWRIW